MKINFLYTTRLLFALTLTLLVSAFSTTAQAQTYTQINGQEIASILQEKGQTVSLDNDGDVIWTVDGVRTLIIIAQDRESIQFVASFSDGNATPSKINQWNKSKRYSRTFLDDQGRPVLKLDLDFAGGITKARIIDYLITCRTSVKRWIEEVVQ